MGIFESKKNVLRADVKESTVRVLGRESGSSLQALGTATDKECCPTSETDRQKPQLFATDSNYDCCYHHRFLLFSLFPKKYKSVQVTRKGSTMIRMGVSG